MAYTATNEPTAYGNMMASGNDGWVYGKVWSYLVSSAVTIAKGDFVKLASSTTNTITRCSSSGDYATFIGIAAGAIDNSAGTVASTNTVGVLREGIAIVDLLVSSSSGTQKAVINFDDLLYLADAETGVYNTCTNTVITGQAMTGTANGAPVARSIDKADVPTASQLYKGRVYINTLLKATMVE